jgi:hypothetical protein
MTVKFPTMQFSGLEIIHNCLALAPLPYLATVFSAFMFIWTSVEQAQASKQQLEVLVQTIAQLLQTLDRQYRAGRLLQARTSTPLSDLGRSVNTYCPLMFEC